MLGFALALAIPFTLFALFPSLLKSLPSSGSWLNSVKISLGFLELALALKFLSNVDLAYHWNWFDREIFLALRSEEHTSELQSLMRISYAVFCLTKKKQK